MRWRLRRSMNRLLLFGQSWISNSRERQSLLMLQLSFCPLLEVECVYVCTGGLVGIFGPYFIFNGLRVYCAFRNIDSGSSTCSNGSSHNSISGRLFRYSHTLPLMGFCFLFKHFVYELIISLSNRFDRSNSQ